MLGSDSIGHTIPPWPILDGFLEFLQDLSTPYKFPSFSNFLPSPLSSLLVMIECLALGTQWWRVWSLPLWSFYEEVRKYITIDHKLLCGKYCERERIKAEWWREIYLSRMYSTFHLNLTLLPHVHLFSKTSSKVSSSPKAYFLPHTIPLYSFKKSLPSLALNLSFENDSIAKCWQHGFFEPQSPCAQIPALSFIDCMTFSKSLCASVFLFLKWG